MEYVPPPPPLPNIPKYYLKLGIDIDFINYSTTQNGLFKRQMPNNAICIQPPSRVK